MFTLPFWVIFALGVLVSLGISLVYGRRAIHPRLRPHFGQVVVLFLVMVLVWFFVAITLGKLVSGGPEELRKEGREPQPAHGTPAKEPAEPASE